MKRTRRLRAYPPDYWDELSGQWDRGLDRASGPHQFYYREADLLISDILGKRLLVLELGCGTGGSTAHHVRQVGGLVATDYSQKMARKARARLAQLPRRLQPAFAVCSATQLPFRPATFDAVFSRGVMLSYVEEPILALAEIRRVLRPGGRLGLDVMNRLDTKNVGRFFRLHGGSPVYEEVRVRDGLQVRRMFRLPATPRYLRWARATRRCKTRPKEVRVRSLSVERFDARLFRPPEIRRMVERAGFHEVRTVPLGHLAYLLGRSKPGLARFARRHRGILTKVTIELADHFKAETALHLFVTARR